MPECDYCGASFDSEAAELKHLKSEHRDDLGPIDKRRIGDVDVDDDGLPTGPIALGVVLLASAGIVAYVVFIAGSGGASGSPVADGTHEHGLVEATIDGQEINFTDSQYTYQDDYFHVHDNQPEPMWHAHGSPITVQYALGTFGIEVNDDGTELTFQDETYRQDDPGTEIRITVNGEPVDPGEYTLEGVSERQAPQGEGDDISIVVETE